MAELPAELIHAILAYITDHISMINLALTSRLCYTTAMPVILAEESRYVREIMIPNEHLSIYEYTDSRSRLPPARLDSPAGPFTGTVRKISFTLIQDTKCMCCIRRTIRRLKDLKRISMNVLGHGGLRSWVTAYMNMCIGRPGIEFVLNGGKGYIPIVVDEEPPFEKWHGPRPMRRPSLPFDHPLHAPLVPAASGTITKKRNGFSSKIARQLKFTETHNLDSPQLGSHSDSDSKPAALGLIPPQICALKLVNECLFSSRLAATVRALAAGNHITSFTLVNLHVRAEKDHRSHSSYGSTHGYYHHLDSMLQPDSAALPDIGSILAALTFPSLTHLSLMRLTPPARVLMQFLGRHPLITDLQLELTIPPADAGIAHSAMSTISAITGGSIPTSPPQRFMSNLARLTGTAHWVLPFVRWRQSKKRSGGDAGHVSALEELELLTGTGVGIGTTTWIPPNHQPWERAELEAVYDALFCATNSSSGSSALPWKSSSSKSFKPTKHPSTVRTEATTRIRSLTLETLSCSHLIDWLMLEAAKRQAWPILSDNVGVGINKLAISEAQTFTIPVKTRVTLLDALGRWCPELAREIEMDERARMHPRHAGVGGDADVETETNAATETPTEPQAWPDADTDADTQPDTIQKDDFTQRLLKRIIWHTFPGLQTLQIGVDQREYPPAQRISRPVGR